MIEIRALTVDDADALCEIRLTALREEGQYFTASLSEEESYTKLQWKAAAAETTGHVMFGAFIEGDLIGIIGARSLEIDATGKTSYWCSLYILPQYRALDIGTRLLASTDNWSRANGYSKARFSIHPDNKGAIRLVKKLGAKFLHTEPLRFSDGAIAHALWFEKALG